MKKLDEKNNAKGNDKHDLKFNRKYNIKRENETEFAEESDHKINLYGESTNDSQYLREVINEPNEGSL